MNTGSHAGESPCWLWAKKVVILQYQFQEMPRPVGCPLVRVCSCVLHTQYERDGADEKIQAVKISHSGFNRRA